MKQSEWDALDAEEKAYKLQVYRSRQMMQAWEQHIQAEAVERQTAQRNTK